MTVEVVITPAFFSLTVWKFKSYPEIDPVGSNGPSNGRRCLAGLKNNGICCQRHIKEIIDMQELNFHHEAKAYQIGQQLSSKNSLIKP